MTYLNFTPNEIGSKLAGLCNDFFQIPDNRDKLESAAGVFAVKTQKVRSCAHALTTLLAAVKAGKRGGEVNEYMAANTASGGLTYPIFRLIYDCKFDYRSARQSIYIRAKKGGSTPSSIYARTHRLAILKECEEFFSDPKNKGALVKAFETLGVKK